MSEAVDVFWWPVKNFGDRLNEILLPHYGIPITRIDAADAAEADVNGLGSILNFVPPDFEGIILGAGFRWKHQRRRFERADIRIVRGRLTAERCGAPASTCLGDPGLLLRPFAPEVLQPRYALGIIPHLSELNLPVMDALRNRFGSEAIVIDLRDPIDRVLAAMSECACIASSSLHGLVAADAMGLPNAWILMSDRVGGSGFKFPDYFSAFAPDDRTRKPLRLCGDESLSWLQRRMVKPGAAVQDVTGRLDEIFTGLSVDSLRKRRRLSA